MQNNMMKETNKNIQNVSENIVTLFLNTFVDGELYGNEDDHCFVIPYCLLLSELKFHFMKST